MRFLRAPFLSGRCLWTAGLFCPPSSLQATACAAALDTELTVAPVFAHTRVSPVLRYIWVGVRLCKHRGHVLSSLILLVVTDFVFLFGFCLSSFVVCLFWERFRLAGRPRRGGAWRGIDSMCCSGADASVTLCLLAIVMCEKTVAACNSQRIQHNCTSIYADGCCYIWAHFCLFFTRDKQLWKLDTRAYGHMVACHYM